MTAFYKIKVVSMFDTFTHAKKMFFENLKYCIELQLETCKALVFTQFAILRAGEHPLLLNMCVFVNK